MVYPLVILKTWTWEENRVLSVDISLRQRIHDRGIECDLYSNHLRTSPMTFKQPELYLNPFSVVSK